MGEHICIWNHNPPSEFEDLPRGVGGWTIAKPFFDEVEGDNVFGVDKEGLNYLGMKNRRDAYESYYDTRMTLIDGWVADLSTELSIVVIEDKLDDIHAKLLEIDLEYLDAIQDIHAFMDLEDAELYDDYMDYLDSL